MGAATASVAEGAGTAAADGSVGEEVALVAGAVVVVGTAATFCGCVVADAGDSADAGVAGAGAGAGSTAATTGAAVSLFGASSGLGSGVTAGPEGGGAFGAGGGMMPSGVMRTAAWAGARIRSTPRRRPRSAARAESASAQHGRGAAGFQRNSPMGRDDGV
jgi:hypothetical protein